jgi:MFS transporter, DHA1 family, tetracycline resistance protein
LPPLFPGWLGMPDRLPLIFILITIVLDAMGIGLIMPVMPDLIREVQGVSLSDAAVWGGILVASFAVTQFLFSPMLGNLSDRFGRRPVLLISLAMMAVDYVIMALAGTIWWLLLGRLLGGITSATPATASAFVADISSPDKRAQNFGLISAAFGIGFIIGPVIGGLLAGLGPRAPFVAAAIFAAANFAFGYFVLPESLPPEKRRAFLWRRANPLGGFLQIGKLPGLKWMLVAMFFYSVAGYVYPAIWAYYTQEAFGWDARLVGLSLALYGTGMIIVQGGLIRIVIPWLGEARAVIYGLIIDVAVLLAFGFANQAWMIWALVPLAALGSIATPAITALMSRRASENQQGELQGVLGSINAMSMILSPLIMTQAFFWFTREATSIYLPGAPFLLATILMLAALAIFLGSLRRVI